MAKMFYTLDEAKASLGRSEDEIKQLSREGRLREFRDGPRLMFKADQVEQLKNDLGPGGGMGDAVDLGVSDSGGMIGLVDTTGASGTRITLTENDTGQSSVGGLRMKEDTALAADLGMSGSMAGLGGSMGGIPSPARPGGGTGSGLSGTSSGRGGINVFGADDMPGTVDPSAQTAMANTSVRAQMDLAGVGSGSGLLDLTRESDDTSLGAVLDEITPGATVTSRSSVVDTGTGIAALGDEPVVDRRPMATSPVYVQQLDPMAPALGGMALEGAVAMLFGLFVLISALVGTWPDFVKDLGNKGNPMLLPLGAGIGLAVVMFIVGMVIGKAGRR